VILLTLAITVSPEVHDLLRAGRNAMLAAKATADGVERVAARLKPRPFKTSEALA
jgi:hypothetical protein